MNHLYLFFEYRPKLDCTIHKRKECKSVQDLNCGKKVRRSTENFNSFHENEVNLKRTSSTFNSVPKKSSFPNNSKVKVKHKEKNGLNFKQKYPPQSLTTSDKNCQSISKTVCDWIPYKKKCINRPVTECYGSSPVIQCNKKCENVYYCTNCPILTSTTTTTNIPPAPSPPPPLESTTTQLPFLTTTEIPLPPAPPLEPMPPSPPPGGENPAAPLPPPAVGIIHPPSGEEIQPPSPPVGPIVLPPG